MELITPGIGLLFWLVISFLSLFFVLKKFAWPVILRMLQERETSIENALNAAEKAKEEIANFKDESQQILNKAKNERDAILRDANTAKNQLLEQTKIEARKEYEKILKDAKDAVNYEKMAAIEELKNEIAGLSILIAEKIIQENLKDPDSQRELIDKLIENVRINIK